MLDKKKAVKTISDFIGNAQKEVEKKHKTAEKKIELANKKITAKKRKKKAAKIAGTVFTSLIVPVAVVAVYSITQNRNFDKRIAELKRITKDKKNVAKDALADKTCNCGKHNSFMPCDCDKKDNCHTGSGKTCCKNKSTENTVDNVNNDHHVNPKDVIDSANKVKEESNDVTTPLAEDNIITNDQKKRTI